MRLEQLLVQQPGAAFLGPDGRHVLLLRSENANFPVGTASVYDMRERRSRPLATHGDQVTLMAWDPSGTRIVTGSREGIVRVGPVTGEEPHLLIGHQGPIWAPHLATRPVPRKAAVTDERSDCPGRFGVYRIPDDVPAIPRVAAQSADVVTERYDIRNLLLAFRLTPPEIIGNQ